MYKAIDIAHYFLSFSDEDAGDTISNLKIQKLLYYAQGLHLAAFDKPLFNEDVEAWKHGPVVPVIYRQFKDYGSNTIPYIEDEMPYEIDSDTENFLNDVYETYGQFSAWKLRNMTHDERPWIETAEGGVIEPELMKEFFKDYIN